MAATPVPEFKKNFFVQSKTNPIVEDYIFDKKIGEGSFGSVYLAKNKRSNNKVAIKQMARNRIRKPSRLQNEISVISNADHPNIVRVYEIYEDPRNVYFVTEVLEGGELYEAIIKGGKFNEIQARKYFHQLIYALNYLHANGVAHRDLKPENMLFATRDSDETAKLIDFGFANYFEEGKTMQSRVGTPFYISP